MRGDEFIDSMLLLARLFSCSLTLLRIMSLLNVTLDFINSELFTDIEWVQKVGESIFQPNPILEFDISTELFLPNLSANILESRKLIVK